jgi:hypothetical protein
MQKGQCSPFRKFPPKALAAALAATLGCPSPDAIATDDVVSTAATWKVTNCLDSGSGSLRDAVQNLAASGDTVDLNQTPCSTISLTTGAIIITQNALTLTGPGRDKLAIDGANDLPGFGVLFHNGTGTLEVDNLTITHGSKYTNLVHSYARGGCILSTGNVTLSYSTVSNCTATGSGTVKAGGGGIYAHGNLMLSHSTVTGNTAQVLGTGNSTDGAASGGGVYVVGALTAIYSTIGQNMAPGNSHRNGHYSYGGGVIVGGDATFTASTVSGNSAWHGGGIYAFGNLTLTRSTISGNQATSGGGLVARCPFNGVVIGNSTISGNIAPGSDGRYGAMYLACPAAIYNSTVAFNQATTYGGIYTVGNTLNLQSSIIADNSASGVPSDLNVYPNTLVIGANNLIVASATAPPDTITDCPRLGPLANNGGVTLTHALSHASPAVDMGNNALVLPTDQRGAEFVRAFGAGADIGAFEWQRGPDERIFISGFELGCAN